MAEFIYKTGPTYHQGLFFFEPNDLTFEDFKIIYQANDNREQKDFNISER